MKSPIRTDYRISKKNGKPIFDLKDMLMIVESLEEEALANEHRELDELYEKRINERIKHLRNQYEHQEITERNKRNERKQKAIDEEKKALQEKAAQERASSEALARELEAAKKAEEEAEKKKEAAKAQAKAAAEAEAKAKLEAEQKQKVQTPPPVSTAPASTPPTAPVVSNQPKADDSRLSVFLDINAIKGLIESWETKCAKLLKPESKEDKEMAMKIKRQVAVPVGALTQRSGTDLRAQIDKILNLVKNKDYPENKTAGDFVIYETAYRFVQLAEEQLSSNEKAAPAIAIAVIALWLESAEFGELFMSQLYNTCPILIPNTFNENVDEQKLKQMGGMCRLFASLASSDCPPGTATHPFGIENIWKFLVGTVLVPNVTELTCQALYEVLTFSGKRLQGYYKNQFGKLIKLIISNFIPRCSGGPGARLRLLLEGAIQNGFKDPPGAIGQGFWGTRDMYTGKMSHIDNTKIEAYDFPYDQSSFGQSNVDQKSLNPEEMIEEAARKREHRLIKNREAARECRRKKKEYIKCLENRVQVLENQNKALIEELHKLKRTYEDSGSRLQGISTDGTGQPGQNPVVNQTTNQISPQVALHLAMANPHLPLNNHPFT